MELVEVIDSVDGHAQPSDRCHAHGRRPARSAAALVAGRSARSLSPPSSPTPSPWPEQAVAEASRSSLREAEREPSPAASTTEAVPGLGDALDDGAVSGAHDDVVRSVRSGASAHITDSAPSLATMRADWVVRTTATESTPAEPSARRRPRARASTPGRRRRRPPRTPAPGHAVAHLDRRRGHVVPPRAGSTRRPASSSPGSAAPPRSIDLSHGSHARPLALGPDSNQPGFLRAQALLGLTSARRAVRPGATGGSPRSSIHSSPSPAAPVVDWGTSPSSLAGPVSSTACLGRSAARTSARCVVSNGVVLHAPGQLDLGRTSRLANRAQRRAFAQRCTRRARCPAAPPATTSAGSTTWSGGSTEV